MVSLDRFLVEGSLQLLFYEEGLLPLELRLSKEFMSLAQMPGRKPRLSQAALLEMSGYPERPQDSQPDPARLQFFSRRASRCQSKNLNFVNDSLLAAGKCTILQLKRGRFQHAWAAYWLLSFVTCTDFDPSVGLQALSSVYSE